MGCGWATNAAGRRAAVIRRNGVDIVTTDQPGNATNVTSNASITIDLAAGDTVTFNAYQTAAATLDTAANATRNF
jgi:molybdopterin-guanine dinucleotide biosynthesis protein